MSVVSGTRSAPDPARFRPYPAYKATGVEWLGEVPAHWEVKRLKFVAHVEAGQSPSSDQVSDGSGGLPFLQGNADFGTISPTPRQSCDAAPKHAQPGDMLLSVRAPVGALNVANQAYGIGRGLCAIRFGHVVDRRFGFHALLEARKQLDSVATGSTFDAVTASDIGDLPQVLPEGPEQRAIASFLDHEAVRIDALVARKERLIELLQERRTALITQAVTKGLDPNVPMNDSGVEWLREIPEHWVARRIKWMAQLVSGHTPDKKVESYWLGGEIPWVSLADTQQLRELDYIASTTWMTTEEGIAHSSAHVLPEGTVIFSRDATIGLCAITCSGMAVSQHFIGWVCGQGVRPEYLLLVLRSMGQELERLTMGATVRTIGMPDVKSLVMPVPPVEEQSAIVDFVRGQRSHIDALITKVREAIDRLKELRSALISAAVTGKIDVREEVG